VPCSHTVTSTFFSSHFSLTFLSLSISCYYTNYNIRYSPIILFLNVCYRSHYCGPWFSSSAASSSSSQEAGRQAISAETAEKAKGKTGQEGEGKALSSCHASQHVLSFIPFIR
jgi:hypothetical protein